MIGASFLKLKTYCESENYKGWDPYDGLNSKIFNLLPLKNSDLARFFWIQFFKRNPINFRKLLMVPKEFNPKGIALLLLGYCDLYDLIVSGDKRFGTRYEVLDKIKLLAIILESLKIERYTGSCWGYNFDWQARQLFFFPRGTPTVVATAFCAESLLRAYSITGDESLKQSALSSANFVINDLNRTPHNSGFLLSYSPIKGNDTVYNASLLGAKLLSSIYKYSKNDVHRETAQTIIRTVCEDQNEDGSWVYGLLPIQNWKDSFHTGYNLSSIIKYQEVTNDHTYAGNLDLGLNYYINNFFKLDGCPKYYNDKTYPIDIHSPAQLILTLSACKKFTKYSDLAERVMRWTIDNMQHKNGFFYYQIKRIFSSKISYMRWSNAFMFRSMSCYLKEVNK